MIVLRLSLGLIKSLSLISKEGLDLKDYSTTLIP